MNTNPNNTDAELQLWIKEQLNKGVYQLVDQKIFDQALVEAKPAWILPHSLLIGKIRDKGTESSTRWFICGDCETLHIPEEMANSPRAAMRHFSLLWQANLGEEVLLDNTGQQTALKKAESLYELSQESQLWKPDS